MKHLRVPGNYGYRRTAISFQTKPASRQNGRREPMVDSAKPKGVDRVWVFVYSVRTVPRSPDEAGLPTGSGNRRRANRGVRRSNEPETGPEGKATSVAGRRCGGASSHGESRWRSVSSGLFLH